VALEQCAAVVLDRRSVLRGRLPWLRAFPASLREGITALGHVVHAEPESVGLQVAADVSLASFSSASIGGRQSTSFKVVRRAQSKRLRRDCIHYFYRWDPNCAVTWLLGQMATTPCV
jgi:hypothetical protein